jgi:hypothetical protein
MTTIVIPQKEYNKILKTQNILVSQVSDLKQFIINTVTNDELNVRTIKKLEKISKEVDIGGGKRFKTISSVKRYLHNL